MAFRGIITAASVGVGAALTLDSRSGKFLAREGLAAEMSTEVHEELHGLAVSVLDPEVSGVASVQQGLLAIQGKMNVRAAARAVAKRKLPEEVTALVSSAAQGTREDFDEASMDKARIALNSLVEQAWAEMDDEIIECKEYQEMNRQTFDQISADIARLVEQITDLERVETESLEGISKTDQSIKDVRAEIEKETRIYQYNYAKNSEELTTRQNDLDVFTFILRFTSTGCVDGAPAFPSMLQTTSQANSSEFRICGTDTGHSMCFHDRSQQTKFNQLMEHGSKSKSVSRLLQEVYAEAEKQEQEQAPTTTANPAIAASLSAPAAPAGPTITYGSLGGPFCCEAYGIGCDQPGGGRKCVQTGTSTCFLHDKLSLLWGDYKDKVDELTMEMNKNAYMFEEVKITLNDQITLLANTKARYAMMLSEARSNLAADREEVKVKQQQKEEVDKNYRTEMKRCCDEIKWIMYQDVCAVIIVRNAVLADSTACPGDRIVDCEVDNWVGQKCTVECDDECPQIPDQTEVYTCGGWQTISRKTVVKADACGLHCPALSRTKKCNQKKCPVNCEMSEWSGWSKCTADCEGGVRSMTRSLMIKPKNGGESCDTTEYVEACNTMSCDRDCTLADWTDWTPCSVACGGGMQSRAKHVVIPIRGFGKCPKESSFERSAERACNTQACVGDEICIAHQDLIIAVDGSASLLEDQFNALRDYTNALVQKFRSTYFGDAAMKVGLIAFGNGYIEEDENTHEQTISPAINLVPLTSDLNNVKASMLSHQKGFTNMAQAFALAETMYTSGGRQGAQSALLVLTDGKPSFEFQTNELVQQLEDKGVQRFFVVVNDDDKALDLMKKWASAPWETNLLHVPSFAAFEADNNLWAQKALTLFCPAAMSPELLEVKEERGGFIHVKDGGYCGSRGSLLSTEVKDAEGCAFLAQGAGAQSFLLGTWFRRGYCYVGDMTVDTAQYTAWATGDRANPACPTEWVSSMIFDFYAMEPVAVEASAD